MQLQEAVMTIHAVLDALLAEGVPSERIIVGGFGQGAALAAQSIIRYQSPLAGGVLLSAWLPCFKTLRTSATSAGCKAKMLWIHGARDAVVHPDVAMLHVQRLQRLGVRVTFRLFPELAFGVNDAAITRIK